MAIDWRNVNYLDSVQLPGVQDKYWIKDTEAREKIEALANATHFLGVSTTEITDGGSQTPTINGATVTPVAGDIVIYKVNRGTELSPQWVPLEFIYDGEKWQLLGDQSFDNLGDLAFKDSASGSYTPEGSINLVSELTDVVTDVTNGTLEVATTFSATQSPDHDLSVINLGFSGALTTTSISYFGSSRALNYINLASEDSKGNSYTTVVTGIDLFSSTAIGGFRPGQLPSIANQSTVTVAMGTGSSSTTLIFNLSNIGFNPGTEPEVVYLDVYSPSVDHTDIIYTSVSFLTLSPNTANIPTDITGTTALYYSIVLSGSIATDSADVLSGVSATFGGSTTTITVS